ncbi:MAG: TRAP transporter substrate-binding protein [Candidatus Rokubacteria bacterium]|nr:TRAP transporter substrate-binding protein [Candidatus Rokubacteria bacterium]
MKRAGTLSLLAAALFVAVFLGKDTAPDAAAQAPIKLKIQSAFPAVSIVYGNLKYFAERVEKMSGGRIKVEALPAGAVVPAFEILDAAHRGLLEGGHGVSYYWFGRHPAATLFAGAPGGPFGMSLLDLMGWFYEGGGLDLYHELYQKLLKLDVVVFPISPHGPQPPGWFRRPVKNWEDFRGFKARIPGIAGDVYKEAGMSVVLLPGGEIIPAAERGLIDAAEWVGGREDLLLGLHTVGWKYHYLQGQHEPNTHGNLFINKKVWERLSPDLQEIIKSATKDAFLTFWWQFNQENAKAYQEILKLGINTQRMPDDINEVFLKTWDKVAARFAEKDPFFKKVLDSMREYASLTVPHRESHWPTWSFAAQYYWKDKIYAK